MVLHIGDRDEDKDRWRINCAPQCTTDILVQVTDLWRLENDPEDQGADFSFKLGKLMVEEAGNATMPGGLLWATDDEAANIARWADQFEAYAAIMRSALRSRDPESIGLRSGWGDEEIDASEIPP